MQKIIELLGTNTTVQKRDDISSVQYKNKIKWNKIRAKLKTVSKSKPFV